MHSNLSTISRRRPYIQLKVIAQTQITQIHWNKLSTNTKLVPVRVDRFSNRHAFRNTRKRNVRSKIWWFTEFCNSHYLSQFAAFFIVARAKRSVVKSCFSIHLVNDSDKNKKYKGLFIIWWFGFPADRKVKPPETDMIAHSVLVKNQIIC